MDVLITVAAYFVGLVVGVKVGFDLGKRVPYGRSLREEAARRYGVLTVYVRAFLSVVSPAYKRRWDRQRADALEAFRASLKPIERAPWAHRDE